MPISTKIRLIMLCLSDFELYSRWVPLLERPNRLVKLTKLNQIGLNPRKSFLVCYQQQFYDLKHCEPTRDENELIQFFEQLWNVIISLTCQPQVTNHAKNAWQALNRHSSGPDRFTTERRCYEIIQKLIDVLNCHFFRVCFF